MRKILIALSLVITLAVAGDVGAYYDGSFTLQDDMQCVGGTLLGSYTDVQDTGNLGIQSKNLAAADCRNLMTGPGQCCDVDYQRIIVPPPGVGIYYFDYSVYTGATLAPETPPASWTGPSTMPALQQPTTVFERWAGMSGPASPSGASVTAGLVANPTSIVTGEQSLLTWSSTGASQCVGTNFSTNGATAGSVVVGPSLTTVYSVSCAAAGTSVTTPPTTINHGEADAYNSPAVIADMQASGINLPAVQGNTGFSNNQTTMNRVCVLIDGPGSTATNIGARSYSSPGNNAVVSYNGTGWVRTGGVSVHMSTSFSCSKPGTTSSTPRQTASASATVTVSDPSDPDPEFTASCRAHPTQANIGEDVLWSSTVSGGEGSYTYDWSGTDNLTGTANQVFKKYTTTGQKTASLTVTYTPNTPQPITAPPPPEPPPPPANPPSTIPPAAICPAIGFVTPVTPCSGVWAPTYNSGGCQSGWQCIAITGGGGGGGVIIPEDTSFLNSLQNLLNFESPSVQGVPEIQRIDGNILFDFMKLFDIEEAFAATTYQWTSYTEPQWVQICNASGSGMVSPTPVCPTSGPPTVCTAANVGSTYTCATQSEFDKCYSNGQPLNYVADARIYTCEPATSASACTPTARNDQWYTSAEGGVLIFNEGLANPYDCAFAASSEGYQYWNQTTNINPGQFDPAFTVCIGYRTVIGNVAMPPTSGRADGIYTPSVEYRSGYVCPGSSAAAGPSCTLSVSPSSVQAGQSAILSWVSNGVSSLTINNGVGTVSPVASGSRTVTPSASLTYAGTGSNAGTSVTTPPTTINHGEADAYNSPAVIADMQASGINLPAVQGNTGFSNNQTTMNRVCVLIDGPGSTATNIGARSYSSPGNNAVVSYNGTGWVRTGGVSVHMSTSFSCSKPGTTSSTPGSSVQCGGNAALTVVQPSAEPQSITVQCENSVHISNAECSDGIDNDGDGYYDYGDDPGCTTSDDDDEEDEDDDDGDEDDDVPECSDGVDNDGDGDVDASDPGCNIGSGSGGGGSYNPNDNSESGAGGGGAPECSDNIDNNGDGNVDFPDDPGCSSANDNLELADGGDGTISLTATPPLVKKGQSCTIELSATNVTSCSLNGPSVSRSFTAVGGIVSLREVVTPALSQSSTFTLSCNSVNGTRVSKSVDCKIAPTFEEF